MRIVVMAILGLGLGSLPIAPDQAKGIVNSVAAMALNSVADLIERSPPGLSASPMYNRKTQSPLMWIHLRKAQPILVNREFYNISGMPGMNVTLNMTPSAILKLKPSEAPKLPIIQQMVRPDLVSSLIQQKMVDPIMIQNGLYLTMPLRKPVQETVNVAAAEDTQTIQGFADYMRKKTRNQKTQQIL